MKQVKCRCLFQFQPFLGGGEFTNAISGRIMLGKETLVTISGHWDEEIFIKDKRTGVSVKLKHFNNGSLCYSWNCVI